MTGIDYKKYKNFGVVCDVPKNILDNLSQYYELVSKQRIPDQTSKGAYKQWYIQKNTASDEAEEGKWSLWTDNGSLELFRNFFNQWVTDIAKFRFSFLQKTQEVDYHSKHSLPRIHIPLNDNNSLFVIKDNNVEYEHVLTYGQAHFVNTTLLHKVKTTNISNRLNCFFCFTDFVDEKIKQQFMR